MNLDDISDDETPSATLKKCGYCCKWLSLDAFAINPKSKALYSKCEPCRPKHAASANTSVNRTALVSAHKKTDKGKATRKRAKTSEKGKATQKRAKTSEKGKAANKKYDTSEKGKARQRRANTSEKGKATQRRAKTSEKGKATQRRAKTSEKGKAAEKRYREGDAGKAAAERFSAKRQKRRQESPAMRLAGAIKCAADHLLAGRIETSPTFLERTSFDSEKDFIEHMKTECLKNGLVFEDRGSWTIDRKIPEEAYDFDNPNDVLRCWSPANITAMTHHDNMEKSWKFTDHWIASAGPACYPLSWQNRPPTDEMKKAHADRMMAPKPVGEQIDGPEEDESEEDEFDSCGEQGLSSRGYEEMSSDSE
jgi:hypothetical protein